MKKKERKKKKTIGDRENGTVVAHIDLAHIDLEPFAQEPNALPVAYCDSGFTVNNSGLLLCTLMHMLSVTYNTHTHKQNYIEILGILGVGDLTFGVGYPPPLPPLLYETRRV